MSGKHRIFKRLLLFFISAGILLGMMSASLADDIEDLGRAAMHGDMEGIRKLLSKNHDLIKAKDKHGNTALVYAVYHGQKEAAQFLILSGADINVKDDDGWTPLIFAAAKGQKEVAQLLIEKGAKVNARDKLGATALIWASKGGNREVVELLLSKGAGVNAACHDGVTALIEAVAKAGDEPKFLEVINLLISKGANVNAKSRNGMTALRWAEEKKQKNIIEVLKKHGAKE